MESSSILTTHNSIDSKVQAALDRAVKHVTEGWIPTNPEIYKLIKRNIKQGVYPDINSLFGDLKKDLALFAFCIRELKPLHIKSERISPIDIVLASTVTQIETIMGNSENKISFHRFEKITPIQAGRLQHLMISTITTETIATKISVNPYRAFSTALLRQLGVALIAWNYPTIYSKAMMQVASEKKELELILQKTLGFSPAQLAVAFVGGWEHEQDKHLNPNDLVNSNKNDPKSSAENIAKLCEIGEALAIINDRDHYPDQIQKFEVVQSKIVGCLGKDGLEIIHKRLKDTFGGYLEVAPALFASQYDLKPTRNKQLSNFARRLCLNNKFIKQLGYGLQQKFEEVYDEIQEGQISNSALKHLVSHVIIQAGFNSGCIYLLDPVKLTLGPKVIIGKGDSTKYKAVDYNDGCGLNPISAAFMRQSPIRENGQTMDGSKVAFIAGAIGESGKIGVLYLEIKQDLSEPISEDSVIKYKAIRQCLNDIFDVKRLS